MNLTIVSQTITDHFSDFDFSKLKKEDGEIIPLDHPLDPEAVAKTCKEKQPDRVFLVLPDPLGHSLKEHGKLTRLLEQQGVNPAQIAFINLNEIFITAENSDDALSRLQTLLLLAEFRMENTPQYPLETYPPEKELILMGQPPDKGFLEYLGEKDVAFQSVLDTDSGDGAGVKIIEFRGFPGNYTLDWKEEGSRKQVRGCALIIFPDSLTDEQKEEVSTALRYPMLNNTFLAPENRRSHKNGVWLVQTLKELQTALQTIKPICEGKEVTNFIESATVDSSRCGLCGTCVKTCMFNASTLDTERQTSVVDPAKCVACGNCVTACPTQARDLPSYSNSYMHGLMQSLHGFTQADGTRLLVIACESNGYAAVNHLANEKIKVSSSCMFMQVRCGARIESFLVPETLKGGFDGIAILICARHECRNIVGSLDLERRLNLYRSVMKANRIEPGRLRIIPVSERKLDSVPAVLNKFADYLANLESPEGSIFSL